MEFQTAISGFLALYIFMLAAFTGWVIIGRVPAILHTPLMSGSNFVHGIVVVGGLFALLNASTTIEQAIGFFAVLLGAGNVAGGYAVTERPGGADRGDDESASILHALRLHHQPGGRHRSARARRGRHEKNARPVSSPPRLHRAPVQ